MCYSWLLERAEQLAWHPREGHKPGLELPSHGLALRQTPGPAYFITETTYPLNCCHYLPYVLPPDLLLSFLCEIPGAQELLQMEHHRHMQTTSARQAQQPLDIQRGPGLSSGKGATSPFCHLYGGLSMVTITDTECPA